MDLIRSISWISSSHLRLVRDDDSHIDLLSHRYTVAIFVLFAIIVSTKQYAGDPIDCWVPAQFKASYEKYKNMSHIERYTYAKYIVIIKTGSNKTYV